MTQTILPIDANTRIVGKREWEAQKVNGYHNGEPKWRRVTGHKLLSVVLTELFQDDLRHCGAQSLVDLEKFARSRLEGLCSAFDQQEFVVGRKV